MFCAPLLPIVPLIYVLGFNALGRGSPQMRPFCLRLSGWTVALGLRVPMMVLAFRPTHNVNEQVVAAMAGPAEESVRLLAVLCLQASFASAMWLGLGWATIEVLDALVSGFTNVVILSQGGVGALQLRKRFLDTGLTVRETVYGGIFERVSATALHIGFTLLLAYRHVLLLITLPLHSLISMGALNLTKRLAFATQMVIALVEWRPGVGISSFFNDERMTAQSDKSSHR